MDSMNRLVLHSCCCCCCCSVFVLSIYSPDYFLLCFNLFVVIPAIIRLFFCSSSEQRRADETDIDDLNRIYIFFVFALFFSSICSLSFNAYSKWKVIYLKIESFFFSPFLSLVCVGGFNMGKDISFEVYNTLYRCCFVHFFCLFFSASLFLLL